MYIIRNNQKGKVILNDLGLILGQQEETDLDLRFSRERIAQSAHLKHALHKNIISLIKDDLIVNQEASESVTIFKTDIDHVALESLEKRLRQHLADEISKINPSTEYNLDEKLNTILTAIQKHTTDGTKIKTNEIEEDTEAMKEVHKKVVERITKNTSGHIVAEKTEVNNELPNIDEIKDFI